MELQHEANTIDPEGKLIQRQQRSFPKCFTEFSEFSEFNDKTRMHSSGMRTTCLLPISPSMQCSLGGGCTWLGGVPAQGVYLPGGVPGWGLYLPGGEVPDWGGVPARGVYLPRYSPCEQND